jgi:hypothetical protein
MRVFSGGASDNDGHMNIHILGGGHLVMRDPEAVGEAGEHTGARVCVCACVCVCVWCVCMCLYIHATLYALSTIL